MDAQIRVAADDEVAEVAELWEWLRGERALAGMVRAVQRPPGEGELGGAVDVLTVALGSGGAAAMLASSLTTWLRTRRSAVTVTVTTEAGTVKVDAHNLKPDDVLPVLQRVLSGGDA
jgi:hypothetical protein